MTGRIPVVVLAGYLGSGKTTLLNHLLRNNAGRRIGVLVNDFGSINVDAMSVAGQVDVAVSLENGCMCCAVDADGVGRMLARLAYPGAPIDAIVIEASGIAEPRQLVRLVLSVDNPHLEFGGMVEVVDAAEFEDTRRRHPQLDEHVRFADLVVVNKIDRVGPADRTRVVEQVRELADGAVLATEHGRIPPEILFDDSRPGNGENAARQLSFADLERDEHDHDGHLHSAYDSLEFVSDQPLKPTAFWEFLNARSRGVYRIKGPIDFGPSGGGWRYLLHTVGVSARIERGRWPARGTRRTSLVLIGTDLDAGKLTAQLEACVDPDPAAIDEHGMRYLARHLDIPVPPVDDAAGQEWDSLG